MCCDSIPWTALQLAGRSGPRRTTWRSAPARLPESGHLPAQACPGRDFGLLAAHRGRNRPARCGLPNFARWPARSAPQDAHRPTSAAPRGSDIPSPGPPRGVPCVNGREPIEAPGRCAARRSARRRPPRRSPARDSHASTTAPRGAATLPYVCAVLTRRAPAWPWASRGRGPVESPPYCLGERSRCLGTYQH